MKKKLKLILFTLNIIFKNQGSIIRFKATGAKSIRITILTDKYIESSNINMTKEFYIELENQLKEMGLSKPHYNNFSTIFYCIKNGGIEWE